MAETPIARPSVTEAEIRESGIFSPAPLPDPMLPPNEGKLPVPQFLTFAGVVNQISRTYRHTFDESLKDCWFASKAMRRDPVLMGALRARYYPTLQLEYHLEAQDPSDPKQMEAVTNLTGIIREIPYFTDYKRNLLEAIWYGRSAVQQTLQWDYTRGYKRLVVGSWNPVNGDKLVFKWAAATSDEGGVGVLVHPMFQGSWEPTERGRCHFYDRTERQCVVIHHFEREDSDFFDFEQAGAVQGVGVRGRLYWFWWLKTKIMGQLVDYLQRVALGYTVFYYQAGNPESYAEVYKLAQDYDGKSIILFPRVEGNSGPKVERLEAGVAGADLFRSLVTSYFDDVMDMYIKGQQLTTGTAPTGLGSGVAAAHEATREMIVQYDATCLGETLTEELVKVLCRHNHPGVPCPRFVFDVEKPNVQEYMEGAKAFFEMGGTLDADDMRSVLGIPAPEPNHEVLSQMQSQQPATIGTPQGVPVESAGAPGGDGQDQGQGPPQPTNGQPVNGVPGVPGQSVPNGAVQMMRNKSFRNAMVQLARRKKLLLNRRGG